MTGNDWGALLPEDVSDLVNFEREDKDWKYEGTEAKSMSSRQAEGVAYLWNLLSLHGVALLADEVGMGKTFQALGVASLLWKMKPDAKILMMAPNRDICAHWRREFGAFVKFHYRHVDHCVKNAADGGPVQSIQNCWKLEDLATSVESGVGHLYLTTIYSLSGLVPQSEKGNDNNAKARRSARRIHERIKSALNSEGFDLVIVDEAHYFRNRSGDSQRVHAAQSFFGEPSSPLAMKTLLLTATPSHTSLNDVSNILSYFLQFDDDSDRSAQYLLQRYGLRRLRRMKGLGGHFGKNEYRHEKERPCDFENRPESEMFFGLYQKKLVTELGLTKNNRSLLYGFLEGFESIGRNRIPSEGNADGEQHQDEEERKDFSTAKGTELLARLTKKYHDSFRKLPDHPKYGQIVELCKPTNLFDGLRAVNEDKHLIFVRRIPSVRELTQRINEAYDTVLAEKIFTAWGFTAHDIAVRRWRKSGWSRAVFEELVESKQSGTVDQEIEILATDDAEIEDRDVDAYLGSSVADLFVVKEGKNGRTDCSNVSLRFRKAESAFAMFLEPASDYRSTGYTTYFENEQAGKVRADYSNAARHARLQLHDSFSQKLETRSLNAKTKNYRREVLTVWSLIFPLLSSSESEKLTEWSSNRPDVAENFGNYIKTGFLFASPVMVEIYAWFTEFNRRSQLTDVQEKYAAFLQFVTPRIPGSLTLSYFKSALNTFETLCEKIIDHKLGEWEKDWRVLTSLQNPAWYASGKSQNRQRLILGFNSPFYPNVLIATSVFQEGVNLHLQCRKVHHYGMAGSPGDNEQRVGRVDRLFGRVNSLLEEKGCAELEINFPFLKSSFDEEQVASFITRKFNVEEKMDACVQPTFDRSVQLTSAPWREYLRSPLKATPTQDPYRADFKEALLPLKKYAPFDNHQDSQITAHIGSLLNEIIDHSKERLFTVSRNSHTPRALFLIDPVVEKDRIFRQQPILVERQFSELFSGLVNGTVYYVTLKSPLLSREAFDNLRLSNEADFIGAIQRAFDKFPLVKVSIDRNSGMSHSYVYARVDLPIFVKRGSLGMLSKDELYMAVEQLKHCADHLEFDLLNGKRDLASSELNISNYLAKDDSKVAPFSALATDIQSSSNWKLISCNTGTLERLETKLTLPLKGSQLLDFDDINHVEVRKVQQLVFNHQIPFLSYIQHDGHIHASINYPASDFHADERILLERWFEYVISCHLDK